MTDRDREGEGEGEGEGRGEERTGRGQFVFVKGVDIKEDVSLCLYKLNILLLWCKLNGEDLHTGHC